MTTVLDSGEYQGEKCKSVAMNSEFHYQLHKQGQEAPLLYQKLKNVNFFQGNSSYDVEVGRF